jgi:hypothetical protein
MGKITSKVWEDEYADIIPNYMKALHAGFQREYEELVVDLEAQREKLDPKEQADLIEILDYRIKNPSVGQEAKNAIWKEAMDASWGGIDIKEFEENWLKYVKDYLK